MDTSSSTAASSPACKLLAAVLLACAAALLVVGTIALPPVLEHWILVENDLGGGFREATLYALAIACLAAAPLVAHAALQVGAREGPVPARLARNALVSIAAVVALAVLSAEAGLRAKKSPEDVLSGDALWIHRWLARRAGAAAGAGAPLDRADALHRHDPELGWTPKPDLRTERVSTNSRGARGSREDPAPKPAGERRIVVVGDSFTWGEGVADAEAWPAVLETLLPGTRVVNLAVCGYGTDQQHLRLERDGWALEPDLVVVGVFARDVDRDVLAFRDYAKPRFDVERGALRLATGRIPDPDDPYARWPDPAPLSYLAAWLDSRARAAFDRTRFAPKWTVARAIQDATLVSADTHGAGLLLLHFPSKPAAFQGRPEASEVILGEWAFSRGVPFASLRETFAALGADARFEVFHDHWTPHGNALVAGAVARAIEKSRLLEER